MSLEGDEECPARENDGGSGKRGQNGRQEGTVVWLRDG
jgi:hypothetical protein